MSGSYGPADEAESVATLHHALDLGVDFLDTADSYGDGHNEALGTDQRNGAVLDRVASAAGGVSSLASSSKARF